MEGWVFQSIHFGRYLGKGSHAFTGRPLLPVPVFLIFHKNKSSTYSAAVEGGATLNGGGWAA
jgi:hypothetical protein